MCKLVHMLTWKMCCDHNHHLDLHYGLLRDRRRLVGHQLSQQRSWEVPLMDTRECQEVGVAFLELMVLITKKILILLQLSQLFKFFCTFNVISYIEIILLHEGCSRRRSILHLTLSEFKRIKYLKFPTEIIRRT